MHGRGDLGYMARESPTMRGRGIARVGSILLGSVKAQNHLQTPNQTLANTLLNASTAVSICSRVCVAV